MYVDFNYRVNENFVSHRTLLRKTCFILTHRRKEGQRSISASIVSADIHGIGRWSVVFNLVRMVAWTTLTLGTLEGASLLNRHYEGRRYC